MVQLTIGLILLIVLSVVAFIALTVLGRELMTHSFHYSPYILVTFIVLGVISGIWSIIIKRKS